MATPDHTPHGRGYEDSLLYFHHMNDYYDSTYENPSGICDGTTRPVRTHHCFVCII
jgi:arylsulfatase I/J